MKGGQVIVIKRKKATKSRRESWAMERGPESSPERDEDDEG